MRIFDDRLWTALLDESGSVASSEEGDDDDNTVVDDIDWNAALEAVPTKKPKNTRKRQKDGIRVAPSNVDPQSKRAAPRRANKCLKRPVQSVTSEDEIPDSQQTIVIEADYNIEDELAEQDRRAMFNGSDIRGIGRILDPVVNF